jgi:hypothetical protein
MLFYFILFIYLLIESAYFIYEFSNFKNVIWKTAIAIMKKNYNSKIIQKQGMKIIIWLVLLTKEFLEVTFCGTAQGCFYQYKI